MIVIVIDEIKPAVLRKKRAAESIKLIQAIEQMKEENKKEKPKLPDPAELDESGMFLLFQLYDLLVKKREISPEELLKKAIELNAPPLAEHLLPYCKNINVRWQAGNTLLHIAAAKGRPLLIRILGYHHALDYSIKNNEGQTALERFAIADPYKGRYADGEIKRLIKIRIYIWLHKADVRNEQGQKLVLPVEVCRLISRMVKL